MQLFAFSYISVTVTVTNAFILRLLLKNRGRITESSARSLVSVDRLKQKCFQLAAEVVGRLQLFQPVGSLLHTEKARSPIRRRVRGTTKLPRVEARSAHLAGT